MLAIVTSHPIQYQAPLWRELARTGKIPFEVWFLTPHAVKPSLDRDFGTTFAWDVDLLSGFPHRFLEVEPGWRLDRFGGVRLRESWGRLLRAHQVTALWVEGWRFRTLWTAVRAARQLGIPVWLRGENNDLAAESLAKRLWKHTALRWYFSQVSRFLYIGTPNRRFYRRLGVDERRMAPAPYCVDVARFRAAADRLGPERPSIRAAWNIAPEARCLLFCAKLIGKKRPSDVLAGAERAAASTGFPIHLLWVGDGQLGAEIEAAAKRQTHVRSTFAGFVNQSEIPRAYTAADLLVLASDAGETWGLVVNEALASGLPAVASDRCGCAEDLVRTQGPGRVFPCGDINGLAEAIATALRSPPPQELLQHISDRHAPMRTAETVVELLASRHDD